MLCLKVHGPRFWFWCLQFDWRRGKTSRWGQVKNNHWNLQKKKNRLFFGGGGNLSWGRCNITKVLNNTIHLPSMIGCAVTAGLHFVLPVSGGQSPTDDLYAALPTGVEDFMILLHIAPPHTHTHTLILVPRVISTMDRSWKLYQKGFDPVMTLRQQVPVHWVIHDPKVVRLLLN